MWVNLEPSALSLRVPTTPTTELGQLLGALPGGRRQRPEDWADRTSAKRFRVPRALNLILLCRTIALGSSGTGWRCALHLHQPAHADPERHSQPVQGQFNMTAVAHYKVSARLYSLSEDSDTSPGRKSCTRFVALA